MNLKFDNKNDFPVLVFVEEVFPRARGILSRQVEARKEITLPVELEGMMTVTLIPIRPTEKNNTLEAGASVGS